MIEFHKGSDSISYRVNRHPRSRKIGDIIALTLIISTFIGIYTFGSIFFPFDIFIISGLIGLIFLKKNHWAIRPMLYIFAFSTFHFVVIILLQIEFANWVEQARSQSLFILTIFACLGFAATIDKLGMNVFRSVIFFMLSLLLTGILLENANVIRDFSEYIRKNIYDSSILYLGESRDETLFGAIRPKLFSSEPSYLAKFVGAIAAAAYLVAKTRLRVILIASISVILFFQVRSVANLGGVSIIFLGIATDRASITRLKNIYKSAIWLVFALLFLVAANQMIARLGLNGDLVEDSAYLRLIQPYAQAVTALTQRPLLGFGLGADSAVWRIKLESLYASNAPLGVLLTADRSLTDGSFVFSTFWQYGVVGVGMLVYLFYLLIKRADPNKGLILSLYFGSLGLVTANIHTPYMWAYFTLVLSSAHLGAASTNTLGTQR